MKFLIDANVLSAPCVPNPDRNAVQWIRDHEHECVIDPIVLGEIRIGILNLLQSKRRAKLERWFDYFTSRIKCLPWDSTTALRWAKLVSGLHTAGKKMAIKDSMIAATALVHDLTVCTRNTKDFSLAGVFLVNPFLAQGEAGAES